MGRPYLRKSHVDVRFYDGTAMTPYTLDITGDSEIEDEEFLHGQCGYAAVIALDEDQENEFVDKMFDNNVKLTLLGHVTKGELRIDDDKLGQISDFIE